MKLRNAISDIHIQQQLLLIFLIAIFIPALAAGSYLIINTRSQLVSHYLDLSESDNARIKSLMLDLTSDVYNRADTLTSDAELTGILEKQYASSAQAAEDMENYPGFGSLLSQDASIEDADVYSLNRTVPEGQYIHPVTEEIEASAWYKESVSFAAPFWSQELTEDDFHNKRNALCLNIRIFLPESSSYAILKLTVNENNLKNRIEGSGLSTFLWLNSGDLFYSSRAIKENPLPELLKASGSHYSGSARIDGRETIGCISSFRPAYTDDNFYMASFDFNGYSYINRLTVLYLAGFAAVMAASSLLIYFSSRHFSRRVIALRKSMHSARLGNYEIVDTFSGKDEISEAFDDLNAMIQSILSKEASIYEARLKTKELENQQQKMEFKMLTSQINPHFLFNTLETIRMRAVIAGNRDVADAIKLLGKSLRYVLQNTAAPTATLKDELDYIETYLAIQRLRFHDRVNYSAKVPPDIRTADYLLMPLLLQPVVENAMLHGLEEVEQNGRIILHVTLKSGRLIIKIYDNGCGMTKAELSAMRENIYHHPEESARSIGLANIYKRIRLYYGADYGLSIQSKIRCGTCVTLELPARNRPETGKEQKS